MRRRAIAALSGAAFLTLSVAIGGAAAAAGGAGDPAQLQEAGWWTQMAPVAGLGTVAGPDVPPQGLLIESDVDGTPVAYAALTFALPTDEVAGTLTLAIAPRTATNTSSTIKICPLVNPTFKSEYGGPASDAPAYDCTNSVSGTLNSAGTAVQVDVAALQVADVFGVAVLPTAPSDRVVFQAPTGSSLSVTLEPGAGARPAPPVTVPSTAGPAGGPSPAAPPVTATPSLPPGAAASTALPFASAPVRAPATAVSPPVNPVVPATASQPSTSSAPVTGRSPTNNSASSSFGSFDAFSSPVMPAKPLAIFLVLGGLVIGAGLWFYAGRRRPEELTAVP